MTGCDTPLLSARALPTAFSHMDARSFVGMPLHHSLRIAGFLCTILQSGTMLRSHRCNDSSTFFSRARRRSCNAFRLFSSNPGQNKSGKIEKRANMFLYQQPDFVSSFSPSLPYVCCPLAYSLGVGMRVLSY